MTWYMDCITCNLRKEFRTRLGARGTAVEHFDRNPDHNVHYSDDKFRHDFKVDRKSAREWKQQ